MRKRPVGINTADIDLIVYDFDGVMTDNRVLVFEDGKEAVICNRADGLAIDKIKRLGIPQIILSTERNKVVRARAKKLDIKVLHGVRDKKSVLMTYCEEKKYNLKKVIYIGNDLNDLEAMKIVGYPVSPADGHRDIRDISRLVLSKRGGDSLISELIGLFKGEA